MARQINRLSARAVQTLTARGRHADGGGLYLVIDETGAKRWAFIYRDRRTQKLREMGFGGVDSVSLAQAETRQPMREPCWRTAGILSAIASRIPKTNPSRRSVP